MLKNKSLVLPFLLIAGFVSGALILLYRSNQAIPVVLSVERPLPPASPSPTPVSQISPDGTHTLSLKAKGEKTEIIVNEKPISSLTDTNFEDLSIPFNTWSPDNKYFFLNAKIADQREYLVFRESVLPVATDILYYKINELFELAYPDKIITSVTGWAAPTLLIINAKSDTEAKMSFWFDVQAHKFIRLSNYFY